MAEGVKIEIVSPERLLLSEQANSVTIPGADGYFTVMGDHAPLMTTLKPGFVTVSAAGGHSEVYYVRSGFADISPDGVTILAEDASRFADFDRPGVEAAIAQAEADLAAAETPEDKGFAQEVVNGLRNLLIDAQHLGGAHVH
jgi:F-type H+-transporting ATPase subunit epsilon